MNKKPLKITTCLQLETYVSDKYIIDPNCYSTTDSEVTYIIEENQIRISFVPKKKTIKEDMVAGDTVYNPQNKKTYTETKLAEAYKAAFNVQYNNKENIIEYISTYGLPVSDAVVYLPESDNCFKDFRINIIPKTLTPADEFCDVNPWSYTQKAFLLFNKMTHLKYLLQAFNLNQSSDSIPNLCEPIQDIICIMQCYERNIFYHDIKRTSNKDTWIAPFLGTRTEHYDIYRSTSAKFAYYIFNTNWWDTEIPPVDEILKTMRDFREIPEPHNYYNISLKYNNQQTALLLKLLMTVASLCQKNNCTLKQFAETKEVKFSNIDILQNYNDHSRVSYLMETCADKIYKTAETFYYDLLTDIILECSPVIEKISDNELRYSYHFPNLLHSLFYMLYKDTDNLKECLNCHQLYPSASRRSDSKYCSESCGTCYRKQKQRKKYNSNNSIT